MTGLAETVRWFRKRNGWTQGKLAKKLCVHKNTVLRIEARSDIALRHLEAISGAFGVTPSQLLAPLEKKSQDVVLKVDAA